MNSARSASDRCSAWASSCTVVGRGACLTPRSRSLMARAQACLLGQRLLREAGSSPVAAQQVPEGEAVLPGHATSPPPRLPGRMAGPPLLLGRPAALSAIVARSLGVHQPTRSAGAPHCVGNV